MKLSRITFKVHPSYWEILPYMSDDSYGKEEKWRDVEFSFLFLTLTISYHAK